MISLEDRGRGMLVGVLTGDALGAPYEKSWTVEQIQADFAVRGGLIPFDYDDPWGKDGRFPAGRPTDDSELTAVLADCLINKDDEETAYQRFRSCVIDQKSVLYTFPAPSLSPSSTTYRALVHSTYAEAQAKPDPSPPIPSNGALMRTAPVALRYFGRDACMSGVAKRAARITHRHPQAVDCTVVYCHLLDLLLKGRSYENAAAVLNDAIHLITKDEEIRQIFRQPLERPQTTRKFDGTALYTLQVAHYVVATTDNVRDAITNAVSFSGDTDTYAAVAGGLLGALYGIQGIPEDWQKALLGRNRMITLADRLLAARLSEP